VSAFLSGDSSNKESKSITSLKDIKNELRLINAILKSDKINPCQAEVCKYRISQLNLAKKKFINSIIYLKTAYIMIDRMFSQEILNAELRRKYCCSFFIYDCFPLCIKKLFIICNISSECCLPINYKSDPTQGTLLEEILNFDNRYAIRGITDEELYHFHKRYEKFKNKNNNKNLVIKIGSLFSTNKNEKKIEKFDEKKDEYYLGDLDERNHAIKHINRLLTGPIPVTGDKDEEETEDIATDIPSPTPTPPSPPFPGPDVGPP